MMCNDKKCQELRHQILHIVHNARSGHIGGSFSAVELLTVLFYEFLKIDPKNPETETRDYFVLSKGHVTPIYYSILADLGFFPKEWLEGFRQVQSPLQGHPSHKIPGVEVSTGSLGQGFGNAGGMALALKHQKKDNVVVCLLGDGELQEGIVWETAMAASHFQLNHLLAIVDYNSYQIDGAVHNIMNIDPLIEKFRAFGWEAIFIDGHDIQDIRRAYYQFYNTLSVRTKPYVIIAKTIKGRGVHFMENQYSWHGKAPNQEEYQNALQALRQEEGADS